jgi:hypothetical protein
MPLSGEIFWKKSPLSAGTETFTESEASCLLSGELHPARKRKSKDRNAREVIFIAVGSVSDLNIVKSYALSGEVFKNIGRFNLI